MSARRAVTVLAVTCGSLLSASPAAGADHYTEPAGHETRVELQGSDGYRVKVYALDRAWVAIQTIKGGVTTEYRVPGADTDPYGVDSRFADLGRVRFRFTPNGRGHRVPPPSWCEGAAGRVLKGVVRGRIRFRGEGGYTQVSVVRAKAEVETWPRLRCRYGESGNGPRRWKALFYAFQEWLPIVDFSAVLSKRRFRPPSKRAFFQVSTNSQRGRVEIYRSAAVFGDASTFVVPDPQATPENILLRPPPPFSGTGSLRRTPESVFSWEGDLSVQFPGVAPLSITGSTFDVEYCALERCVNQEPFKAGLAPKVEG